MTLKRTRHLDIYITIKELTEEHPDYFVSRLCTLGHITRASYYKWKNRRDNENDILNNRIAEKVKEIHDEHPDMGYRRIRDTLEHDYNINVNDKASETEGRLEGQLLAQEFIRDDIINAGYNLFLDIHSNRGPSGPGDYQITNFIFAPGFDEPSEKLMNGIIDAIDEIVYYAPEFRSSPPYITEPTAQAGIPTLVYECYSSEDFNFTCMLAEKLVDVVDSLF